MCTDVRFFIINNIVIILPHLLHQPVDAHQEGIGYRKSRSR